MYEHNEHKQLGSQPYYIRVGLTVHLLAKHPDTGIVWLDFFQVTEEYDNADDVIRDEDIECAMHEAQWWNRSHPRRVHFLPARRR